MTLESRVYAAFPCIFDKLKDANGRRCPMDGSDYTCVACSVRGDVLKLCQELVEEAVERIADALARALTLTP